MPINLRHHDESFSPHVMYGPTFSDWITQRQGQIIKPLTCIPLLVIHGKMTNILLKHGVEVNVLATHALMSASALWTSPLILEINENQAKHISSYPTIWRVYHTRQREGAEKFLSVLSESLKPEPESFRSLPRLLRPMWQKINSFLSGQ